MVEAMRQGHTVNVDGYELGHQYFAEASAIVLAAGPRSHAGPCLVVGVDRQAARPTTELERLAAAYPRATMRQAVEEPFWKEIPRFYDTAPALFTVTTDWLSGPP